MSAVRAVDVPGVVEVDPDYEQFIDAKELARRTGWKRSTIYDWAQKGELPAVYIGRTWCFFWSEVQDVIARKRRERMQEVKRG